MYFNIETFFNHTLVSTLTSMDRKCSLQNSNQEEIVFVPILYISTLLQVNQYINDVLNESNTVTKLCFIGI